MSGQPGKPARKLGGGWEIIGPEACPIMYRRTLISHRLGKVLWHRFLPGASDEAHHDHCARHAELNVGERFKLVAL